MEYYFNEIKTTQIAALLLSMNNNTMNYMKLIKLLYLIDRKALIDWGFPLTLDRYVSMDRGPVLSKTYNLIIEGVENKENSYWYSFISEPSHYSVELVREPVDDDLSEAEIELIKKIDKKYKNKNQWDMVEIVHKLPEWVDPKGSSIPIKYEDIFKKAKIPESDIKNNMKEIESLHLTSILFANAK
ncbi:SocA family protein [candidate division KSB1 bacterium]|nr:SocA family protein [candidate division KSB1 bacterium]